MTPSTLVVQVLGWTGMVLYVIAYALVSTGRVGGRAPSYQTLNLIGALGVAANAFYYGAYPSALVNVIWFAIAAATLLGVIRARTESDPAHPGSPEGQAVLRLVGFGGALLAVFGLGLAVIAVMPRPERPMQPVLVFTQDWKPYVGRELPGGGPLSELVRDVLRGANYDARVTFTDWEDALAKVETGVGAAAFPFIEGEARAERVLFTEPLLEFDYVLFFPRGLTAPTGERDGEALREWLDRRSALPGGDGPAAGAWDGVDWKLGAVTGYALWPALAEVADVDAYFDTPADAFRALDRGEIQFLAEGLLVGRHTIQDPATGVDASRILAAERGDPRSSSRERLHLVTARGAAGRAIRDEVNARIAELRQRGELRALDARFEALDRVEVVLHGVTEAIGGLDGDSATYRLAAGTRAQVLEWPPGFGPEPAGAATPPPTVGDGRSRVKLLNGPLRGWEVLVPVASFAIVERGLDP